MKMQNNEKDNIFLRRDGVRPRGDDRLQVRQQKQRKYETRTDIDTGVGQEVPQERQGESPQGDVPQSFRQVVTFGNLHKKARQSDLLTKK